MADAQGRPVFPYHYNSNKTTEFTRFRADYFAGADIRIYFGDIWIDEVTSLQFTLQEQVAPIFGYASYTWDKVARGSRYIQGSFSINFKESYYLQQVMKSLSSEMGSDTKNGTSGFNTTTWKKGLDIEALMKQTGNKNFDSIADEFEKSLWGTSTDKNFVQDSKVRESNSYFYPNAVDSSGKAITDMSQKELQDHGFNILISYGPMNESGGMNATETTHTLVGVQLTGVSQVIGSDGSPIQEQYTFIAKDLDGNMTVKY
jgi:hypothetical protein